MSDIDQRQMPLPPWIEHNGEHVGKFRHWAVLAGPAEDKIRVTAELMGVANICLEDPLERLLAEAEEGQP